MPRIEAKKEEGDWLKEAMESLWGQNRFWTSIKHLENIGLLDKKDVSEIKKKKIEYLLVGIVKQEYIKTKKQITHIKTTVNLLNGDFDITKEKKVSMKKINTDYEEFLFHLYSEGIKSPHSSETLRFVQDSELLKVNIRSVGKNLLLLLLKNDLVTSVFEGSLKWQHSRIKQDMLDAYEEKSANLIYAKRHFVDEYIKKEKDVIKKYALAEKIIAKNIEYFTSIDGQKIVEFEEFFVNHYSEIMGLDDTSLSLKCFSYFLQHKRYKFCDLAIKEKLQIPWGHQETYLNEYLEAIILLDKNLLSEAITRFESVIKKSSDDELIIGCYFNLFIIYQSLKDTIGMKNSTDRFYDFVSQVNYYDFFVFQLQNPTKTFFLDAIKKQFNETKNQAKLIAVYLYIKYISSSNRNADNFSKANLKEIAKLTERLKKICGRDVFQYYVISKASHLVKKYDQAMTYRIKYILNKGDDYLDTEISQCSYSYQENYAKKIKSLIEETRDEDEAELDYVSELFNEDVNNLFQEKRYGVISEIYGEFEDSIQPHLFPPPFQKDSYFDSKAFEVAYSLNENRQTDDAKKIYEGIEEPSWSVLNNLSLIYEKENNIEEARRLILLAEKKNNGESERVQRNKNRLFTETENQDISDIDRDVFEAKEDDSEYIIYNTKQRSLSYLGEKKRILGTKKPEIMKLIFKKPKEPKPSINIIDELGLKVDVKERSIRDAVFSVNKTLKEIGADEDVFSYQASTVFCNEDYWGLIKIVE